VAEAALQSGFEDPNYFARWFRRQTGQTPQAWRR
jgi:AraC-like DNA-binding protein